MTFLSLDYVGKTSRETNGLSSSSKDRNTRWGLTFHMVTVSCLPLKFAKSIGVAKVGDASLWETSPPMVV